MRYPVYAVIMAGGTGERFWPKSRRANPKQLLSLISKRSMIQETIYRLKGIISEKNILVITNKVQVPLVKGHLSGIPEKNIIAEPVSRNTAPCIALAAKIIKKKERGEAIMVVLPSDHVIKNISKFKSAIKNAIKIAEKDKVLVTLGIKPHSPHTGYGYIKLGKYLKNSIYKISGFKEKPDTKTAKGYLRTRKYLWNSGMFVWRTDSILDEIEKFIPNLLKQLRNYKKLPNVSIDYGVMEKTKKAVVIKTDFYWDDVGNWNAIESYFKKDSGNNIIKGKTVVKNTNNSIIMSDSVLVATLGVNDMIVVASKDAVLVCPKKEAQNVKQIVGLVKKKYKKHI